MQVKLVWIFLFILFLASCATIEEPKVEIPAFCDGLSGNDWNMCVLNFGLVEEVDVCGLLEEGEEEEEEEEEYCNIVFVNGEVEDLSGERHCVETSSGERICDELRGSNKPISFPKTKINSDEIVMFKVRNTQDSVLHYAIEFSSRNESVQIDALPSRFYIKGLVPGESSLHALRIGGGDSGTHLGQLDILTPGYVDPYASKSFFVEVK